MACFCQSVTRGAAGCYNLVAGRIMGGLYPGLYLLWLGGKRMYSSLEVVSFELGVDSI